MYKTSFSINADACELTVSSFSSHWWRSYTDLGGTLHHSSSHGYWNGFVAPSSISLRKHELTDYVGLKGSSVPIFAAENSPARIRGALVMSWQM